MRTLLCLFLLSVGALAQAPVVPTWIKVTYGYDSDAVVAPVGTSFRYGAPDSPYVCGWGTHNIGDPGVGGWTAPLVTNELTGTITNASFSVYSDPAPCLSKEIDVLETAAVQTITVNGIAVTIPALPGAAPPAGPVNQPGAIITTGEWDGEALPCWRIKVAAKNPDGSPGKNYMLEICGPVD